MRQNLKKHAPPFVRTRQHGIDRRRIIFVYRSVIKYIKMPGFVPQSRPAKNQCFGAQSRFCSNLVSGSVAFFEQMFYCRLS